MKRGGNMEDVIGIVVIWLWQSLFGLIMCFVFGLGDVIEDPKRNLTIGWVILLMIISPAVVSCLLLSTIGLLYKHSLGRLFNIRIFKESK